MGLCSVQRRRKMQASRFMLKEIIMCLGGAGAWMISAWRQGGVRACPRSGASDACRMPFRGLRQAGDCHRHNISRIQGNVARSPSPWRTNHNPPSSPKSTLWPTSASRLLARYPHMAAVRQSFTNLFVAYLTSARSCQESTRSLATRPHQTVHNLDANSTQEWCNRPSSLKVFRHLSSTDLPLSGMFKRFPIRTTWTARQEAHPL